MVVDNTSRVAPILVGILLDYFLFGTLVLQIYIHSYSSPSEKPAIKLLIYTILLIELAQVCCAAADIYYWFGVGYGDVLYLNNSHLSPFDTALMNSLVAFIVQLFFGYRIWILSKNDRFVVIYVVVGTLSVLQLVGGIATGVEAYTNNYLSTPPSGVPSRVYPYIWLIGEAVANVIIAVTLTYLFTTSRNIDSPRQHRGAGNQILALILQSNSLPAVISVIALVLFAGAPDTNYFITPAYILGKLYSNSLLATLNHRMFAKASSGTPNTSRPGYPGYGQNSSSSGTRFTSRLGLSTNDTGSSYQLVARNN